MKDTAKNFYILLFVLALLVNCSGLSVQFFTDDPGLYAAISKNLLYKKDFFELFTYNRDWLDKPHFPFWVILTSFKLFGVSVWAYRLSALLFFFISLLYTWLFAAKYYGRQIAFTAVLMLSATLHILLSNTDVRAEPYLMALIIGAIYHISQLNDRYTLKHLALAALLTACAIMTKGIFVIIAIYGALFGELLLKKRLKDLFDFKWPALVILTFIFTLPELYALYTQFDLHPEKTVFGRHNVSGIKWFLWDSQFGRFINSGPISRVESGSKVFYLHTLLWALAPWCLIFYYAIFKNISAIIKGIKLPEYYALTGGMVLLILFSLSRFQLPFYTNAVFPLFAVITAPLLVNGLSRAEEIFRAVSLWIFIVLLPLIVVVLNYLLRPENNYLFWAGIVLFGAIALLIILKVNDRKIRTFFFACLSVLFAGYYLNTVVFNEITPYKGEIAAAKYVNQKPFDNADIYSVKFENNIFQFYCKKPVKFIPIDEFDKFNPVRPTMFYINQRSMDYLVGSHAKFTILKTFTTYPQENIMPKFINKATRPNVLGHVYLITKPWKHHL
ncbi:glycosyltransferase family 39 protein [Mucilaginibacter sp. L3T2-6]|uniref:ArnT family glycosyltransferase n=1 Tax=Mucilaginibacter sp. L3T2-6 TaxID=3062491 RepID=UPI002676374D|nr:glycosyltransferase family 39 protein [Mucilaginibacter sp. L3T2-6]MDO3640583.1 glycosyltransferase family 39 protein [Mucilaginibacter sp. L3T2-6]MDV6213078.1 glycosyltransferase family 39 protein [Mucilaginibacter sp. L3T2-6]